jgi:hypothetical protein
MKISLTFNIAGSTVTSEVTSVASAEALIRSLGQPTSVNIVNGGNVRWSRTKRCFVSLNTVDSAYLANIVKSFCNQKDVLLDNGASKAEAFQALEELVRRSSK